MHMLVKSLTTAAVFASLAAFGFAQDKAEEIRAADQAWAHAAGAKDLDACVGVLGADGAVMPPNAPIAASKEEARRFFASFFALPGSSIAWHATKVEVARSGEIGYSTGVYETHFNDTSGKTVSDTGKYVTVWKRASDGKWQVVRDIFNSDLPAGH
jgi:ketosteroid isomerase-like protein